MYQINIAIDILGTALPHNLHLRDLLLVLLRHLCVSMVLNIQEGPELFRGHRGPWGGHHVPRKETTRRREPVGIPSAPLGGLVLPGIVDYLSTIYVASLPGE